MPFYIGVLEQNLSVLLFLTFSKLKVVKTYFSLVVPIILLTGQSKDAPNQL